MLRAYQPMSARSSTPESGDPQGNGTVIVCAKRVGCCAPLVVQALILWVELESPRAIEVQPRWPLEIGTRMLGQRDRPARSSAAASRVHACRRSAVQPDESEIPIVHG